MRVFINPVAVNGDTNHTDGGGSSSLPVNIFVCFREGIVSCYVKCRERERWKEVSSRKDPRLDDQRSYLASHFSHLQKKKKKNACRE